MSDTRQTHTEHRQLIEGEVQERIDYLIRYGKELAHFRDVEFPRWIEENSREVAMTRVRLQRLRLGTDIPYSVNGK